MHRNRSRLSHLLHRLHPAHPARLRLMSLLSLAILLASPSYASEAWTLDKEADGIRVYTRAVTGSGIKQFKGTGDVDAPVERILEVLRDTPNFAKWFPNTRESKRLATEANAHYQYSVMETPWPTADRDYVLRTETVRDPETGSVLIRLVAAPDFHPEQPGRVRVRIAQGRWMLDPISPDRTRVTFIMHLDPGGGIPQWMINARVVATPFEALTNLRAQAAQ